MSDFTAWLHCAERTVLSDEVDSDLADFPLMVAYDDDSALASARVDGHDVRFTLGDGETELPYERLQWSGGGGSNVTAKFLVKIPLIDSDEGAIFRVYHGNASAEDGGNATAVWDSCYKTVNHLDEGVATTADFFRDATSNGHHGTLTDAGSAVSQISGPVSYAIDLDGATTHVEIADHDDLDLELEDISIEMWVKPAVADILSYIIFKDDSGLGGYHLGTYTTGAGVWYTRFRLGAQYDEFPASIPPTTGWHHIAWTADRDGLAKCYIDGVFDGPGTSIAAAVAYDQNNAVDLLIGKDATGATYYEGALSELRVSKGVCRTAAWYKFQHANIISAGNEMTAGVKVSTPTAAGSAFAWSLLGGVVKEILVADKYRDKYVVQLTTLDGGSPVFLAFGETAVTGTGVRMEGFGDTARVSGAKARLAMSAISAGAASGGIETNEDVSYRQAKQN